MENNERRIYERFHARFPAKFKDARGDFGRDVFLRDASASGVNILTRDRMFFNDKVTLEVDIPNSSSPLVLNGKIVWSKPASTSMWESGLQLDDIKFMKIQPLFNSSPAI